MKKKSMITSGLTAMVLGVLLSTTTIASGAESLAQNKTVVSAWDKTFSQNDKVTVEKVSFTNRFGINVVADMYLPKNINRAK